MRIAFGFSALILVLAASQPAAAKPSAKPAPAGYCKMLKGEFVGFGEATTRGDAEHALDREIATWEQRSGLKAAPKDRTVACKVYIGWLNEFECKAEATVCRGPSAQAPAKAAAQAPAKRRF